MDMFLGHFTEKSRVEQTWLSELFLSVRDRLLPVLAGITGGLPVDEVALSVVSRLQGCFSSDSLPVSFRCVCVSELLSRQRTACFSSLTMSTSQHRELTREAEQALPNHKALSRANLLLIGCLSTGEDGWRVSDSSGSVHCELLDPETSWMNQPMLFPTWNYIPHNPPGKVGQEAGYLELIASPIHLTPDAVTFDPGGPLSEEVLGVRETARWLGEKRSGGALVCVSGEVCTVSPLLVIAGKRFFCFSLRERDFTVPILVMDSRSVFWRPCVFVGRWVCVSALRASSLRGWAGHRVLSVTSQSRLVARSLAHNQPGTAATEETETETERSQRLSQQESLARVQRLRADEQASGADEPTSGADAEADAVPREEPPAGPSAGPGAACAVKIKRSKIISYKGVISAVTDQEAGLYVIDGKLGLCLAYQPLHWNSGLRPGAEVELQHVHFLFRPSPHGLPTMLCACLRSSVRVTAFSTVTPVGPASSSSHGALPRFLLEKNLGVSEYLWLHYYSNALQQRLCPRWVCERRVWVVASRLLECVCVHEQGREPRDIYREMLQEPHNCPLNEYRVCGAGCEIPPISELCEWLKEKCWSSLSLSALLPPSAAGLTRAELNPLLSWSFRTWSLQDQPKMALLVGILETSPVTATLQFRDQTGAIDCVLVETVEAGSQRAADNTAWLGCLVCARRCALVAERFLKTNFPSWEHLNEEKYITNKLCRVYLQVCVSDLHILSPSTAMSLLLAESENKGTRAITASGERRSEPGSRGNKGAGEKTTDGERSADPGCRVGEGAGDENTDKERASEGTRDGEIEGVGVKGPEEKRTGGGEPGRRSAGKRMREEEEEEGSSESERMKPTEKSGGGDTKRRRTGDQESPAGQPEQGIVGREAGATSDPCVSLAFRVETKQGVALRNHQLLSGATPGLSLSFVTKVTCLGKAQRWDKDPRNGPLQERECDGPHAQLELQFISSAVRWFPLLQPGSVYRLIALHTEDVSVLSLKTESVKGGVKSHGNPSLVVQSLWRINTLAHTPLTTQMGPSEALNIKTVSQILHSSSCPEIVSFYGVISQRITLKEEQGKPPVIQSLIKTKGVCVETDLRFRLTIEDAEVSTPSIQVYLDLTHNPFIPGLLPGATVVLHAFQRSVSRKGNVYCRFLPISCVTVSALGSEDSDSSRHRPPPPMMLLGEWARPEEGQHCMLGRVKAHVTCVLHLKMQWTCSLCGSIYKQDGCSRTFPSCESSTAVFQAEAKVAVEDGTAEAHVWFSSETVPALLVLGATEWEGLQWRMRVRGHLRLYARGRDMVSDMNPEDPLVQYLCVLCSSSSICRELTLTCQLRSQKQEPQLRRIKRGEREFLTKFPSPLQLACTHTTPLPHTL
ncbi:CST complex subunit CTC1 [Clupea harengus]|uniref:CST complex subunit CTC1 n=1 Tax=Clupea harengus TaxID=7950 RepID=A0A6P8H0W6_CLUHA|nr:CST complex subunit CTC1 [Clupea harengus]